LTGSPVPSAIARIIHASNGARLLIAVATINVIRRARRISFGKVERCWSLNHVSSRNAEMMRASVEHHFMYQFAER
jgi:hypothetical protein